MSVSFVCVVCQPPRPWEVVKATLERELQQPWDQVFSEIDHSCLGAASIGQVHRARLRSTGAWVAVKIQFEDAETLFRGDIANMRAFAQIAQPEQAIIFDEIERQFMTEFDYRCEAANLAEVRHNLRQYQHEVVVPRPYPELTTKKVLVMEYLDGVKIITAVKSMFGKLARLAGKNLADLEAEFKQELQESSKPGRAPPPPRALPSATVLALVLRAQHVQRQVRSWAARVWNALVARALGARWQWIVPPHDPDDDIPIINYRSVVETLIRVHTHALLVDGVFNGDPHPGNLLFLRDGRLGLIDYGQTKRLTHEQRLNVARILLALAQRDGERVVQLALATGTRWKRNDPYVIEKMATAFLDRDGRDVTEGKNIQVFFESMHARDPIVVNSDYFVLVGRLTMLLRGLAYAFAMPVSFAATARPVAERVLLAEGNDEDKAWARKPGVFPSGAMKHDALIL